MALIKKNLNSTARNRKSLMLRFIALISSVLVVSGCASVIASSPDQVIIEAGAAETAKALELATIECKKQGKRAVYVGKVTQYQLVFDCLR